MEWLESIFFDYSALQALVVIFFIVAVGLALGRVRICGISLGVTFVFFCGILAGHLGLTIDERMLSFSQNFGLTIFVYALGLQVGPGFFNSFRKGGLQLNMLGVGVIAIGTLMGIILCQITPVNIADMMGIVSGATTNTPALAAAQQTLTQLGLDSSSPALACAITYPLGVIGVILAIILLKKIALHKSKAEVMNDTKDEDSTHIDTFLVENPAIIGKTIREIAEMSTTRFVISRIWREGRVHIPYSDTKLRQDDRILVISSPEMEMHLTILFGQKEDKDWNIGGIDWNTLDGRLVSHQIIVTRPEINGRSIGSLKLRNRYGVNISRVLRSGITLLATPDLILMMGDTLIVVGKEEDVNNMENMVGNTVKNLREPNLVSICMGIVLGLVLGSVPITLPGLSTPVRLGLAGGPIIVGILMGAFGPRVHMVTYTTESANLMLRRLGLSMYLACLGLDAGVHFFETVVRPEGLLWIGLGFLITLLPVLIMGLISLKLCKLDFGTVMGMLCGSMANPMALSYASDSIPNNHPALSYTQVYPLCMFLRVIIVQLVLLFML